MAQFTSIARPYAKAAFEYALANEALASWETLLLALSEVFSDRSLKATLLDPQVGQQRVGEALLAILEKGLASGQANFIRLLVENKRLSALPEIAELYHERLSQYREALAVVLETAAPLSEATITHIKAILSQSLKKQLEITCQTKPELIGGAIIRIGDEVFDGSVARQFERLAMAMKG